MIDTLTLVRIVAGLEPAAEHSAKMAGGDEPPISKFIDYEDAAKEKACELLAARIDQGVKGELRGDFPAIY